MKKRFTHGILLLGAAVALVLSTGLEIGKSSLVQPAHAGTCGTPGKEAGRDHLRDFINGLIASIAKGGGRE